VGVIARPVAVVGGSGIWGLNNRKPPPENRAVILVVLLGRDGDLWGQNLAGVVHHILQRITAKLRMPPLAVNQLGAICNFLTRIRGEFVGRV
jgi:hypothetical protein